MMTKMTITLRLEPPSEESEEGVLVDGEAEEEGRGKSREERPTTSKALTSR